MHLCASGTIVFNVDLENTILIKYEYNSLRGRFFESAIIYKSPMINIQLDYSLFPVLIQLMLK